MQKSWLLKCGSDTIGTVTLETFENWHNYGRLVTGRDYSRFQELLEQLWKADQALEELLESEHTIGEEELQQAEERKEFAETTMDQFDLYFEEMNTHNVQSVHDFRLLDSQGSVYWRFRKLTS
jgi:hypothetical protein